jgi:valyl-tRNA synthetase
MKKLGASADWSRFTFTLDEKVVSQVIATFSKLHQDGLVYRDLKLVNYCTRCGTSYSELEVDHQEQASKLYYLKYGPFTVATTRPETKFGDTAVAVHPSDKRYQEWIGKTIEFEGLNGPVALKVIADEYADPAFGTGVVKITPYHDANDFDVWNRHKAELPEPIQIIGFDGKLTSETGAYAGLKVAAARVQIEKDLRDRGLLDLSQGKDGVDETYNHTIGVCYRCGNVIEPLPLPQFFIKVKPLVTKVLEGIDANEVTIHGAGRDKILRHWLENLRDWNISRQIVWGIRIPVWYQTAGYEDQIHVSYLDAQGSLQKGLLSELLTQKVTLAEIIAGLQQTQVSANTPFVVSSTAPTSGEYLPETDTFDTWFSSGQWPVVTLKANQATDFERFYPTSVMETGYDILPFWVMRMLLLGYYTTGQTPFSHVYLHGLVRDAKGQKMSKSKGNVVNPLEVVEKYSADALRLALVIRSTPGLDKSVGDADFKAMRNFTNKIWNAARFVRTLDQSANGDNDAAFQAKLATVIADITRQLSDYKLGLAAETAYNEFWHWYCDEAIESAKAGHISPAVLRQGLVTFLQLLHPFVPFVTEAVWQEIRSDLTDKADQDLPELLIQHSWPTSR